MNSKISAIIIAFLVLWCVAGVSAKVDVDDITVTLSKNVSNIGTDYLKVNVGTDFYLHIELEDPDGDKNDVEVDIEIEIDGVIVYDDTKEVDLIDREPYIIHIRSKDFDEAGLWEYNLMAYECGRKKIVVKVSGDIGPSESDDNAEIKLVGTDGNLEVEIDPENPTPDDEITVTVKDGGDDQKNIDVKFTHLGGDDTWDEDDKYWDDDRTNRNGEIVLTLSAEKEFKNSLYGVYQIDVWDDDGDYCKYTTTLDLRRSLVIGNPEPADPVVGEDIKIKVTDDDDNPVSNVKIAVSGAGGLKTYTTDTQGYVTFKVDATGNFELIASKTDYSESGIKQILILEKNAVVVGINPNDQEVGKAVEISVTTSEGSALKGSKVIITKPDGTTEELTTPDSGKVMYTPKSAGTYKVSVEIPLYVTTKKEFKAHNVFRVSVPDNPLPGADITITVENQENNLVSGAAVSVKDKDVSGTTDDNGKFTFSLVEPGEYTIIIKKDGYPDAIKKITMQGTISLDLRSKELSLGDILEFVVKDGQNNPVDASVEVTKPNGEKESISDGYKPLSAGGYTISASKSGYDPATDTFMVSPHPLVLESVRKGNNLVVTAIGSGEPVPDITISFDAQGFHEEILTDKNGEAVLDIVESAVSGNVTVTAVDQDYASTSITYEVKQGGGDNYTILLLILVVLIIVIIAVLVFTRGGGKKEGETKRKTESKGTMERKAGGSLNGAKAA